MIAFSSVDLSASINQKLKHHHQLTFKREDAISPLISGNKYRKLVLNLTFAKEHGYNTLLTFGGAYSNHIAACAQAAKECGFQSIGVIRGEELAHLSFDELNPTLASAKATGMHLHFVSRIEYRQRAQLTFQNALIESFTHAFGKIYVIPEGGTNALAIKGCQQILKPEDEQFDVIACAVGTGGTLSGIIQTAHKNQTVIGFPALDGRFLNRDIEHYLHSMDHKIQCQWRLNHDYHFGGYGKTPPELIEFIQYFYDTEHIPLDPIYTGKMVYGIIDMLKRGELSSELNILMIHTGGLQGLCGFNLKQKAHNAPCLSFE